MINQVGHCGGIGRKKEGKIEPLPGPTSITRADKDRLRTDKVTDRQTSDKGMATTNPAYFREQASVNLSTGRGRDSRERERDRKREE